MTINSVGPNTIGTCSSLGIEGHLDDRETSSGQPWELSFQQK